MINVLSLLYGSTAGGCVIGTGALINKRLNDGASGFETSTTTGLVLTASGVIGSLANNIVENNYENTKEKYSAAVVTEAYIDQMSDEELQQALISIGELENENTNSNTDIKII